MHWLYLLTLDDEPVPVVPPLLLPALEPPLLELPPVNPPAGALELLDERADLGLELA